MSRIISTRVGSNFGIWERDVGRWTLQWLLLCLVYTPELNNAEYIIIQYYEWW